MAGVNYPKWTVGETTTWERTVDDDIILVNQAATPLLRVISPTLNNLPETCQSTKFEWVEDELELLASKLGANSGATPTGSVTASATTFYVATGEGEFFLAGHILACEDELMIVTTAGTARSAAARRPAGSVGSTTSVATRSCSRS